MNHIKYYIYVTFRLLFISVVSFAVFSCNKPEKIKTDFKGTTTAVKNGVFWTAECTSLLDSYNTNIVYLYVDKYDQFGEKRESFKISKMKIETGRFKVINGLGISPAPNYSSHYESSVSDDAIDGFYTVLESDSNYIEIDSINLLTYDFSGQYNITFIKDTNFNINPNLSDTIRFLEGEFNTKIQQINIE
jgi:hypothetical protein